MVEEAIPGLWYDPVFRVKTLDGREVWRHRHYKVKQYRKPGNYIFSVLDNGVNSTEHWRIVDCDDDMVGAYQPEPSVTRVTRTLQSQSRLFPRSTNCVPCLTQEEPCHD